MLDDLATVARAMMWGGSEMVDANGDGIDDALEGAGRIVATGAARTAETIARQLELKARQDEQRSRDEASQIRDRMVAEAAAARGQLAAVYRSDWWDGATPEDITRAVVTARAWRDTDPSAVAAEARIARELRERYGIQDLAIAGDRDQVAEAVARAEQTRQDAGVERSESVADVVEASSLAAEAVVLEETLVDVDEAHELQDRSEVLYDSAERRDAFAAELEGTADAQAVAARVTADVAQAVPATEATRSTPRAPRARKTRAHVGAKQLDRGR